MKGIEMSVELFILNTLLKLTRYIKFFLRTREDIDNITVIENDIHTVIDQLLE